MKSMKKALAFVLVLTMVLGSFSMALAADLSDVKGTKYENAVDTLVDLGVIDGFTDGTYRPANQVTRAQFVKLVVSALGYEPMQMDTIFTDVTKDSIYSGYVAFAYTLGITTGKTATTFAPSEPVTYNQAIAFLTRAMGYTPDYLKTLGNYSYPLSEIVAAQGMGMLDTCKTTGNTPATRGDIALMIYDLLDEQTLSYKDYNKTWEKGQTLLTKLGAHDYVANGVTGGAFVVTGNEPFADGFNYIPYLGKNVSAYVNGKDKIFAVNEIKSTTLIGKLNGAGELKVGDTTYILALGSAQPATVLEFKNAEYTTSEAAASLTTDKAFTFEVDVTGKKITAIYSASEWEITHAKKVTDDDLKKINTAKKQSLLGVNFTLDDDYEIDNSKFELIGVNSLADIKKDNIVYVYKGGANSEIVRIAVGTEVVTGKVTYFVENDYYKIEGTKYDLVEAGTENMSIDEVKVSKTVEAYLDAYGDVYFAKLVAGEPDTYAIVLNAAKGNPADWAGNKTEKAARVMLYNMADGSVKEYNVKADGVLTYKDGTTKNEFTATGAGILTKGAIVKYGVADDVLESAITVAGFTTAAATSKIGYIANHYIAEDVMVVGVKQDKASVAGFAAATGVNATAQPVSDKTAAPYSLIARNAVINIKDATDIAYHVNSKTGYIDMIMIDSKAVSATDKKLVAITSYGVKDVDGKPKNYVVFLDETEEYLTEFDVQTATIAALYSVVFDVNGYAKLTEEPVYAEETLASSGATTYFSFELNSNGVAKVVKDGTTDSAAYVQALRDDTEYFKYNATKDILEAGQKDDLTGKLVDVKFYNTNSSDTQYATYVVYTLY